MPANPRKPAKDGDNVFVLADVIAEVREEHKPVVIDIGKGSPITVPPIQLWPDPVMELAASEQVVPAVKTLLGDADYRRFTDAGGTSVALLKLLEKAWGGSLGELLGS